MPVIRNPRSLPLIDRRTRQNLFADRVEVASERDRHPSIVVSPEIQVGLPLSVLPREGQGLRTRGPLRGEPALPRRDLESDPLEGMVDGERDRKLGNSDRDSLSDAMDPPDRRI